MHFQSILQQVPQRAPILTAGMLAIIILSFVTLNISQWAADWQLTRANLDISQPIAAQDANAELISAIPNHHLFGHNLAANGEVPISSLELRVTGIVKVDSKENENNSKAYISISGAPSKIYQVGDSLPDGVKVYDITADAIILENGGHLEKLPLPRDRLRFKPREMV